MAWRHGPRDLPGPGPAVARGGLPPGPTTGGAARRPVGAGGPRRGRRRCRRGARSSSSPTARTTFPAARPGVGGPHCSHDLGVDGEFLLSVGTLEPRKNLARLIEAYGRARPRLPGALAARRGRSGGMGRQRPPFGGRRGGPRRRRRADRSGRRRHPGRSVRAGPSPRLRAADGRIRLPAGGGDAPGHPGRVEPDAQSRWCGTGRRSRAGRRHRRRPSSLRPPTRRGAPSSWPAVSNGRRPDVAAVGARHVTLWESLA